jgi:CubicO group peptidase (beta-lactamase class C family)
VQEFLRAIAAGGIELHGFLLVRGGAVVVEGFWRPYSAERPHMQHSATKSWTAAAVGLVMDQGRLKLDDKIATFFPEHLPPQPSANLLAMSVRDLLTMRTGHAAGLSGGAWRGRRDSWVRAFLAEPVPHAPGERFIYSSGSSYLLSALVTRVMGETVHELLNRHIGRPMGMSPLRWDGSPEGYSTGGNGLTCLAEDMAKFGLLHLQGGVWQGARLLPAWWVHEATQPHVPHASLGSMDGRRYAEPTAGAAGPGYGYHWWMTPFSGYRASGIFGQHCIVLPEHDTVIVMTAAVQPGDARLLDLTWRHLVPALGRETTGGDAALADTLATLTLPELPAGVAGLMGSLHYKMAPNQAGVSRVSFDFTEENCAFNLVDGRGAHQIDVGLRAARESETTMTGHTLHHEYQPEHMRVLARGAWQAANRFCMTWRFIETAFCDTVTCLFTADTLIMTRRVNTNAGVMEMPELVGERIP